MPDLNHELTLGSLITQTKLAYDKVLRKFAFRYNWLVYLLDAPRCLVYPAYQFRSRRTTASHVRILGCSQVRIFASRFSTR